MERIREEELRSAVSDLTTDVLGAVTVPDPTEASNLGMRAAMHFSTVNKRIGALLRNLDITAADQL